MTAVRVAAWSGAGLLGIVVAFQVALVLGAPWGIATQGGSAEGALAAAGRGLAAFSALVIAAFALGLLGRAGIGPLASHWRWATALTWVCLGYSLLGSVMNAASRSSIERSIWTPACLALVICAAWVLRGSQRRRPKAK